MSCNKDTAHNLTSWVDESLIIIIIQFNLINSDLLMCRVNSQIIIIIIIIIYVHIAYTNIRQIINDNIF